MRYVSLGYMYIKDFKSFIGPHEIELSQGPGLKYVSGVNQITPRLGSNGSGKTTIWDAVIWCWTGYSIRGHRAADLVSWGTKEPHVVTGFTINDVDYSIERIGSPNRLTINGVPAEQHEVDALLLSRERLLHSVVFGQSVDFFLDLSIPKRGELLDQVLGLDLWLTLADNASTKAATLDRQAAQILSDTTYNTGLHSGLAGQIKSVMDADKTWGKQWRTEIDANTKIMQTNEDTLRTLEFKRDTMPVPSPATLDTLQRQISESNEALIVTRRELVICQEWIAQNDEQYQFFQQHTTCPTCQQQITSAFRQDKLAYHGATTEQLQENYHAILANEDAASAVNVEAQQRYSEEYTRSQNIQRETAVLDRDIANLKHTIQGQVDVIQHKLTHPNNPYTAQLNGLRTSLNEISAILTRLGNEHKEVKGEQIKHEYWKTGFKKVRLYQVKCVLARLQLETANAANRLGIGDWTIEYATEVETRSGSMKAGVQVTVKAPNGTVIVEDSGGEEQRVRLAVSTGLSALIQDTAGINFGFEVWDEPSAWLSVEGIDDMLDSLKDRADNLGKSIWLLDHSVLSYPNFDETWVVTKDANGSRMEQLP